MRSQNPSTIRFQLTCLVLAAVLPVWLLSGVLVLHAYSAKRDQVNRSMMETARTLTMAVDRKLTEVQSALLAFATSPVFASGDIAGVHRQAMLLLQSYPGADLIVADGSGQQVVNSARPYGTPLPPRKNPETVRRIFETGRPVISDLFYGALSNRPLVSIDVPVISRGKVIYDLAMTFPSDHLSSVLKGQRFPSDWYGTILDGRHIVVARTRYQERYVGRVVNPQLYRALSLVSEGMIEATNLDRERVYVNFCRSTLSRWSVVVGVPKASIMAETYRWTGWAVAGSTVISLFGIALAVGYARRISGAIRSLVAPSNSIGRGEPAPEVGSYGVKEAGEVARALLQASDLLQARARERDRAERDLSEMIAALKEETRERLNALEKLCEKEQMLLQQSRLAAMGEMISNIAHQWRQPLNILGLNIQQLQLFYETGRFDKPCLDKSVDDSMLLIQHMSKTIDDFGNFFKPDKEVEDFRASKAVENAIQLIKASFDHSNIETLVNLIDDFVIRGYPNEYSQVIINILSNAKDALTSNKTVHPQVTITLRVAEGRFAVTIGDNGGGIPEEIIGKIFEPHFSTKGPQGTGIGLYMAKNIIERNMKGKLSVRNNEAGAEFRIEV